MAKGGLRDRPLKIYQANPTRTNSDLLKAVLVSGLGALVSGLGALISGLGVLVSGLTGRPSAR